MTELADHLRLLLARVGETWCSTCGAAVPRHSVDSVLEAILGGSGDDVTISAPLAATESEGAEAAWARALSRGFLRARGKGAAEWLRLDEPLPPKTRLPIEVYVDRLPATPENRMRLREALELAWREGSGSVDATRASGEKLSFYDGRTCATCGRSFPSRGRSSSRSTAPTARAPIAAGLEISSRSPSSAWCLTPEKTVLEGALDPWAN